MCFPKLLYLFQPTTARGAQAIILFSLSYYWMQAALLTRYVL